MPAEEIASSSELEALATIVPIVISIAVAWVGWRQWRTSKDQLRLEQRHFEHQKELDEARFAHEQRMADLEHRRALFQHRVAIVDAFRAFVDEVYRGGPRNNREADEFMRAFRDFSEGCVTPAKYLFGADAVAALERFREHALKLYMHSRRMDATPEARRGDPGYQQAADEAHVALAWLTENAEATLAALTGEMRPVD